MEESEENTIGPNDKAIKVGDKFRPLAPFYYGFDQPLNSRKYILASTVSTTHTGVTKTGIWALSLNNQKRALIANLDDKTVPAIYNPANNQLSFKALDTRTIAVVTHSHLVYLSIPSLGSAKKQNETKSKDEQTPAGHNRAVRVIAAIRRLPDHAFPTDSAPLKPKLFCHKDEIAYVDKTRTVVVVPLISQLLFVNLKSKKPIRTKKLQSREPTLKGLNVYPDIQGSGKIVLVWWPGSPRPNPKCDIQIYDFRQDKVFPLLGPDSFTGNVAGHEAFSEVIFQDALFNGDTVVISQTFFTSRRFAHPHITVIKLDFSGVPHSESLATEGGAPSDMSQPGMRVVSIRSYLVAAASLYVELLGFSDDGARIMCTDMSRKYFSLGMDNGEHLGTFTPA